MAYVQYTSSSVKVSGQAGEAAAPGLAKAQSDTPAQLRRPALIVAGGALAVYGLSRGKLSGIILALIGGGMVYKGISIPERATEYKHKDQWMEADTAQSVRSLVGEQAYVTHSLHVEKNSMIARRPGELYGFCRDLSNLSKFLPSLESVSVLDDRHSHWVVKTPAGMTAEWDAEIVGDIQGELIAWRSFGGADMDHSGFMRFDPVPDGRGTLVTLAFHYNPPPGNAAARLSKLLEAEPSREVDEGLRSLKQIMETEAGPLVIPAVDQPPGGPVKPRRINAWISERRSEPRKPLFVAEPYTLNFMVGPFYEDSLTIGPEAVIQDSDIPAEGLDTEWRLTSSSVWFAAGDRVGVGWEMIEGTPVWSAKFQLHIPKAGESATRQLRIMAVIDRDTYIEATIWAKGQLYRRLKIDLNVEWPAEGESAPARAVSIVKDTMVSRGTEIGLHSPREWQKPVRRLDIIVGFGEKAQVWDSLTGEYRTVNWTVKSQGISNTLRFLSQKAEKFRDAQIGYLNNIDRDDLLKRLEVLLQKVNSQEPPNFLERVSELGAAHQADWDKKAALDSNLYDVAYYGNELYKAFFPPGSRLSDWMDHLDPGARVNIFWTEDSSTNWIPHVPWALFYRKPPKKGQPVDPLEFLGMRYRIACQSYEIEDVPSKALGRPDKNYRAGLMFWGASERELVDEVRWQVDKMSHWPNQAFMPPAGSEQGRKDLLTGFLNSPLPAPMSLLYFFCHLDADPNTPPYLRFGDTDSQDNILDLADLGSEPLTDHPLVFLNACGSAAAASPYSSNDIERKFFDRRCRAYIGTEIKVPAHLASCFALVFFYFFYNVIDPSKHMTAGEALYQSRLFLWHNYRNIGGLFYAYVNNFDVYLGGPEDLAKLNY